MLGRIFTKKVGDIEPICKDVLEAKDIIDKCFKRSTSASRPNLSI